MLDRSKLLKDISKLSSQLFPDSSMTLDLAADQWSKLNNDPTFAQRAAAAQSSFLVPGWRGDLDATHQIESYQGEYTVLAVDGSQVYPDRHISGAGCFLLNAGGVILTYGETSSAQLFNNPTVYLPEHVSGADESTRFSIDLVDLEREAIELEVALEKAREIAAVQPDIYKRICFVDGSLIFWHLEGKQPEVKKRYLDRYLQSLDQFYHDEFLIAGYISFPKSREIINLIKLSLCRFSVANCIPCYSAYTSFPCKAVDSLVDTALLRRVMPERHRTTLFYSTSNIVEHYPERLRPFFVYLDVGKEIVRLELPAWVADNSAALERVCALAVDQSVKGNGYPVCLAEAHEQAVVKGPDREFFFQLLYKLGIDQKKRIHFSQKSIKKRGMGV